LTDRFETKLLGACPGDYPTRNIWLRPEKGCVLEKQFITCRWATFVCLFLPRDVRRAKRGIAIVVRRSVRPSVRPSVTLMYSGVCVGSPLSHNIGNLDQWEHPQNSGGIGVGSMFSTDKKTVLSRGNCRKENYTENSSQHHFHLHLWHALLKCSVLCWTHQPHSTQRTTGAQLL